METFDAQCFNRIDLPVYPSAEMCVPRWHWLILGDKAAFRFFLADHTLCRLKAKLALALEEGNAGFHVE